MGLEDKTWEDLEDDIVFVIYKQYLETPEDMQEALRYFEKITVNDLIKKAMEK